MHHHYWGHLLFHQSWEEIYREHLGDWKSLCPKRCWERLRAGGEGDDRGCMVGWHHRLSGHKFEQPLGDCEGQGTWHAAVHEVTRIEHDLMTKQQEQQRAGLLR